MALFSLGDIHGKFPQLVDVLRSLPVGATIVAVGDIGIGFPDSNTPSCLDAVDAVAIERNQKLWLMRGNHDDPAIWKTHRREWNSHLKNVRIPEDVHRMKVGNVHAIMVGGATSLDRSHPDRIEGRSWWSNEGVDAEALQKVKHMVEFYGKADILLTHAGAYEAKPGPERDQITFDHYTQVDPTLEADAIGERKFLSEIVKASQAKTVAFGHYHVPLESHDGPIRYRCCAELEAWEYIKRVSLPPLPGLG